MKYFNKILKGSASIIIVLLILQTALVENDNSSPFSTLVERLMEFSFKTQNNDLNGVAGNSVEIAEPSDSQIKEEVFNANDDIPGENESKESEEENIRVPNVDEYIITSEETVFENISLADKMKGYSILRKLKKAEIDRLIDIVKNGVTVNEMIEINDILKANLSEEDIKCLNDIFAKSSSYAWKEKNDRATR